MQLVKSSFTQLLNQRYDKWQDYLNQRSINSKTGKTYYTHKRLRSAYLSLKRNLPVLFVFEDYKELNTTLLFFGVFLQNRNLFQDVQHIVSYPNTMPLSGFMQSSPRKILDSLTSFHESFSRLQSIELSIYTYRQSSPTTGVTAVGCGFFSG